MARAGLPVIRVCGGRLVAGGRVQEPSRLCLAQGHGVMQVIRDQAQLQRGRYRGPGAIRPRKSCGPEIGNSQDHAREQVWKVPPLSSASA